MKDDERIALLGDIDEVSASLGMARLKPKTGDRRTPSLTSATPVGSWAICECLRSRTRQAPTT